MAYCTDCGLAVDDGASFCARCGNAIRAKTGAPTLSDDQPPDQQSPRKRWPALTAVAALVASAAFVVWAFQDTGSSEPTVADLSPSPIDATEELSLVDRVSPAVARIDVETCDSVGNGTGFSVGNRRVLTAAHVVQDAVDIEVVIDDARLQGQVVTVSDRHDLALIELRTDLSHMLEVADVSPAVGSDVTALGFPLGLELTVTRGTVSAVDRSLPGYELTGLVQTDTAISPGSSGGPLVDEHGMVVGVLTGKLVDVSVDGLGYATGPEITGEWLQKWINASGTTSPTRCEGLVTAPPPDQPVAGEAIGWVGIVQSLSVDEYSEAEAEDIAQTYADRWGVRVSVLLSSAWSSLNPGYWAIYSGPFASREAASAWCATIQGQAPSCYPRHVE